MRLKGKPARGQIVVLALLFSAVLSITFGSLVNTIALHAVTERKSLTGTQALDIAEAGIDKAIYELNQSSSYTGETGTALGAGTFTTSVTSIDSSTKRITSTGYVPNSANPVSTKVVKATVSTNSNTVSFRYGVQTGAGGFSLSGGSTVNGSIYANGDISAVTGVHITGSAVAANPAATTTDQVNNSPTPISSCTNTTCITFGTTTAKQDFAQSFQISTAEPLNSIQFYIEKVGSPSDLTLHIVNDNGGSPGTDELMTGTLSASQVTTSFGWVTVTLPSTPVLNPGDTYWMVLDGGASATKYYIIGANSNGYANGTAEVGRYGTSWNASTGLDGYFQLYLGGGTSMIGGNTYNTGVYVGTTGSDVAWAHFVEGATLAGPLYCTSSAYTTKACDTSQGDPPAQPMPVSDGNVAEWEAEAAAGGTMNGDQTVGSSGATMGPKKIVGNLTVNGGGTLTLTGTVWVTGNITVTGGGKVKLDSSYGANDGILMSDGYVSIDGGASFAGSGTAGSYPFVVTTSACPADPGCNGNDAIYLSGGAGAVALVAQNGTVNIDGGTSLKAVTAREIDMSGGATLTYDSGLISSSFSSGPGGSWAYVPGTYVIEP